MKKILLTSITKMLLIGAVPLLLGTFILLKVFKIDDISFYIATCTFIGFLIPAVILFICTILGINHFRLNLYFTIAFWPSKLLLMVLQFVHSSVDTMMVYSISIALNMLLYSLIGLFIALISKFF